ncbi:hypothetical protein [Methylobacterium oxalidis]|uniref:hypothetical protein n=1 Tax=Methylobacterium oxalidis TaxID=944322 RepID=UPI003314AA31
MKLATMMSASSLLGLALTAGVALAQGTGAQPSQQGGDPSGRAGGMPQPGGMGMMKGMMGGMGMGSGSADAKQGGCGMMNKMSALQERVNQLEQRLNAAQTQSPAKPQ